jgi:glycerol-3-phosphate acyltransferase PlsY
MAELVLEVGVSMLAGYLVGSLPVGLLTGRAAGVDIRAVGTGNPGASNMWRNAGLLPAAITGLLTFLQGALPPLAALALTRSVAPAAAAGVGAVVGYGWPIFARFRGGRAVGTATGAALVIAPVPGLVLLAIYTLGAALRQIALAVLLAWVAFVIVCLIAPLSPAVRLAAVGLFLLLMARRLEGVRHETEQGDPLGMVAARILFDRRRNQRLEGPISNG